MKQEEKAQAYDELIERLKDLKFAYRFSPLSNAIEEKFPELKENEDERIRKELISFVKDILACYDKPNAERDEKYESWIAWLEKQSEQKSANKTQPKFTIGDWIVHHGTENIYEVVAVIDNQYQLKYGDTYTVQKRADVDRCARLWTIYDAKPGDVLCDYCKADNNSLISILKKFEHVNFGLAKYSDYSSYCFITAGDKQMFREGTYHHKHDIKPATKEQRDLLFQKMKEAGYEWDADKKELKKIVDEEQIKKNLQDNSFRRMFE